MCGIGISNLKSTGPSKFWKLYPAPEQTIYSTYGEAEQEAIRRARSVGNPVTILEATVRIQRVSPEVEVIKIG